MKNFRKELIVAVIFFVVGFVIFYIIALPNDNELRIVTKTFEESNDVYSIYIEYPQFPDLPDDFNEKIETVVLGASDGFKKSADESRSRRIETSKGGENLKFDYTFGTSWAPATLSDDVVSFVIKTHFYIGGAHGGENIYTFNYDLRNDRDVTLEFLFSSSPDYLQKVSQFAINYLESRLRVSGDTLPNMSMIHDGAGPNKENFDNFTLRALDTITFYFEEYQVAPYSAGSQEVVMPLSYILPKEVAKK
jgi:hypothetical protein